MCFLRFLTNEDPAKVKQAEILFREALAGENQIDDESGGHRRDYLDTRFFYKLEKSDVAAKVEKILNTPNLECPEAPLLFMVLDFNVHAKIVDL